MGRSCFQKPKSMKLWAILPYSWIPRAISWGFMPQIRGSRPNGIAPELDFQFKDGMEEESTFLYIYQKWTRNASRYRHGPREKIHEPIDFEMNPEIAQYNGKQEPIGQEICNLLAQIIDRELPDSQSKIWHAHPVWFLSENPIVGYSKQKNGWRLMFWSGADFKDDTLNVLGKKFKDASIFYTEAGQIETDRLREWLKQSREIQWDYKNIIKRKGILERL